MLLTTLVMLACGQATVPPAHWMPRGCRDRTCWVPVGGRGGAASSPSGISFGAPAVRFEYPFTGSRWPTFAEWPTLEWFAAVGVVDGGTTAWQVIARDGGEQPVTESAAIAVYPSNIPGLRSRWMTLNDGPFVTGQPFDRLFVAGQPHTTEIFGYGSKNAPSTNGFAWFFDSTDTVVRPQVLQTSGQFECSETPGFVVDTADDGLGGYGAMFCASDGGTAMASYISNTLTEADHGGSPVSVVAGKRYYFGTRKTFDLDQSGPTVYGAGFSSALSATKAEQVRQQSFGVWSPSGGATSGGATQYGRGLDNLSVTGQVDFVVPGSPLVPLDNSGLICTAAHTNSFPPSGSKAAIRPTGWTKYGSPWIDAGMPGPFHNLDQVAADNCKLIGYGSDGGTGNDGFIANASFTAQSDGGIQPGWYTSSFVVAAGDAGSVVDKVRLSWVTDGGMSPTTCDYSGLTWSAIRATCTSQLTTAAGALQATVVGGNGDGGPGSFTICHAQQVYSPAAETLEYDNTSRGDVQYSLDPTGWCSETDAGLGYKVCQPRGGKFVVVHTPAYDTHASYDVTTSKGTYYIDDEHDALDHDFGFIVNYTVRDRLNVLMRNCGRVAGGGGCPDTSYYEDLIIDGVRLDAGVPYALGVSWEPTGVAGRFFIHAFFNGCGSCSPYALVDGGAPDGGCLCDATVEIGNDLTGSNHGPGVPTTSTLCNRFDNSVATSAKINAVRFYGVQ